MRIWFISPAILFVLACGSPPCKPYEESPTSAERAELPLSAVRRHGQLLVFYPESRTDWRTLIDLSLFEGFEPGISLKKAKSSLGPPDKSGKDSRGEYWIYVRSEGSVRLGRENQSSPPILLPDAWVLRAIPSDSAPERLFHSSLLPYLLDSGGQQLEVIVMNNCGYPGASAYIRDGRVEQIIWIKNTGSI